MKMLEFTFFFFYKSDKPTDQILIFPIPHNLTVYEWQIMNFDRVLEKKKNLFWTYFTII